jgi:hypothetical protein
LNIPKPEYLVNEILDYFIENENIKNYSNLEQKVLSTLLESLDNTNKYIFSDDFLLYLDEIEDLNFILNSDTNYDNYKIIQNNICIEFIEKIKDLKGNVKEIKNIFQILDRKHPLFIKLFEMLTDKIKKNLEAKLLLYYREDYLKEDWSIPIKTILVYEDGTRQSIDLFPQQVFKMNNQNQSQDQKDSLSQFLDGLFDLFSGISQLIGHPKMEFIYIPKPSKKSGKRFKSKRRKYNYKVAHIFLKKPKITINNNEGKFQSYKLKKKNFSYNIKNIKSNLFLKK